MAASSRRSRARPELHRGQDEAASGTDRSQHRRSSIRLIVRVPRVLEAKTTRLKEEIAMLCEEITFHAAPV
jgi:hypothetical protein